MLLLPGTLLVIATSKDLISLIYSTVYLPAVPILNILICGLAVLTCYATLASIIQANNEPNAALLITVCLIPIDLIANLKLIPIYGTKGAAYATTLTAFIGLVIASLFVFARLGKIMDLTSLFKIGAGSCLIYSLAKLYVMAGALLLLNYAVLFLLYFGLLYIAGEITKVDIERVKAIFSTA